MKHVLLSFFFVLIAYATQAQTGSKVNLSVFPNPATEYFEVQDDSELVGGILVYNLVGKKIREFEYIKGSKYNVTDLPKGMYLIQILDRNKKVLSTQKVNKR